MDLTAGATLGLDAARGVDPARYAIGGATPRVAVRPASADEVAEALRAAGADGLAVVPWGGGVALPSEAAPIRYDAALDLGALDRVVEYDPEDLTLTAECGVTLDVLARTLAERGQELPLEAPHAQRATLGGALAANASGPRRLRLGAPRDRVLGVRYALADGTRARAGGRVVKNVAGYGIHRLLCGSRGGLAVVLEASLKLLPAPAVRVALVHAPAAERLADAAAWAPLGRLEPAYVTVIHDIAPPSLGDADGARVVIGLEDDGAWVAEQEQRFRALLGAPIARLEGVAAQALARELADLEERPGPRLSFTTADHTPAAAAALLADRVPFVFHAAAGRLHVFPDATAAAALAAAWAERGFSSIDARGTGPLARALPRQATVTGLRERIRRALDPERTLALGDDWEARGG